MIWMKTWKEIDRISNSKIQNMIYLVKWRSRIKSLINIMMRTRDLMNSLKMAKMSTSSEGVMLFQEIMTLGLSMKTQMMKLSNKVRARRARLKMGIILKLLTLKATDLLDQEFRGKCFIPHTTHWGPTSIRRKKMPRISLLKCTAEPKRRKWKSTDQKVDWNKNQ